MTTEQTEKVVHPALGAFLSTYSKISAGNSRQRLTPDTQHISAMNMCFGSKLEVIEHLPLGYLQTKNELTTLSHCNAGHRFVLKTHAKTSKKLC